MVWPTLGSRTAKEQNRGVAMDNYAGKYPENQRNVFFRMWSPEFTEPVCRIVYG